MNKLQTQRAVHIATAGVSLIALVAFIISYSALQQTAATYGFPGWQSWLWPLLIDLPILVFAFTSLVIGWLTGQRSWFASSMIVLFSAATVLFNLAHAELHWLNYAVAVMPPLALIVSFEALRELIQIVAAHAHAPMPHDAPAAELPKPKRTMPKPQPAEPPMLQSAPAHDAEPTMLHDTESIIDEAEEIVAVASLYSEPTAPKLWDILDEAARWTAYQERKAMGLTDQAIAEELGCSRASITRLKSRFEVRAANSNGNGVQHG